MSDQNQWQNAAWGAPTEGAPAPAGSESGWPVQSPSQPAPQASCPSQPQPQPASQAAQVRPNATQQAQGVPYGSGYGAAQARPAYAQPQLQFHPQPQAAPKRRGWIVGLAAVLAFFLLGMVSIASCTSVLTTPVALSADMSSWADTVSGDTVGIINIDGTIQYDGSTSSPEGLEAQLAAAEANPHIKAVVLRVDSGGGVATAGEEMSRYVRDFSKPVVVSCASMSASAAYMISSQADYIFTAKTSAVGAIGVIMQVTDLSGLYEKLGISVDNITSADSKDSSYGNRPLTEEERAYYQNQVDQINEVFVQTVAEGRGMAEDEVRALATGLTFTGLDAVDNGLADEIGTLEDAVAKACELAGVAGADTVYLQDSGSDLGRLLDIMGSESKGSVTETLKELENRVGLEG